MAGVLAVAPHTLTQSLLLHLLPGVVNLGAYYVGTTVLAHPSVPAQLTYSVFVNVVALIPVQLGILYYVGRRRGNALFRLEGVVLYAQRLSLPRLAYWVLAVLLPTGLIFTMLGPLTTSLQHSVDWIFVGPPGPTEDVYPAWLATTTVGLNLFLTALWVPIIEEWYFRGYLLPRMPQQLGAWGPIVHSGLFAIYHLDSLWMVPVRTLGLLPLIYVARRTRSVTPGIVAHCLVNAFEILDRARG